MTDRVITANSSEWPEQLNDLAIPPAQLYLRGDGNLRTLCSRSLAMVGSRSSTVYGDTIAADLAGALTEKGFCIVSGGAYGIDAAAHRGALAAATTVIVTAGPVDTPYPRANGRVFDKAVASGGLIVSEYAEGAPRRTQFLERNRLVAALTQGTIVVECTERSGTMNTVRHARDLGRLVMAVPGPVTSALSVGCHSLIRHGHAELVTNSTDVEVCLEWARHESD